MNRGGGRGRGAPRGRSGYNPNINVTGGDVQPPDSHKPYFRGAPNRGRGGYQGGPPRQGGPPPPNHQGNGNMVQSNNQFNPMKRGPPVGPPGPKRGEFNRTRT